MRLPRKRAGFTLLELVVVMAILVALAGLIVAKLDVLQLKSEKAAAAVEIRDVNRLVQVFKATTNFYPDRWDSLVDRTGGTPALRQPGPPGGTTGLDPGLAGGNGFTAKLTLNAAALTANQAKSLSRLGITKVYDHNGTVTPGSNYGNGFVTANVINSSGTGDADDVFATITAGNKILQAIYPTPPDVDNGGGAGVAVIPADRVLVVLGLGKFNTIVGSNLDSAVITEAPTYPYSNAQYYDRFICVFEAYNNGDRCKLVATLGADGDLAADEIAAFNKQ